MYETVTSGSNRLSFSGNHYSGEEISVLYYQLGQLNQANQESALNWRKSRYSAGNGECVEVAKSELYVQVRDSRNKTGTVLKVKAGPWQGFLSRFKSGDVCHGRIRPGLASILYLPAVPEAPLPFIASA